MVLTGVDGCVTKVAPFALADHITIKRTAHKQLQKYDTEVKFIHVRMADIYGDRWYKLREKNERVMDWSKTYIPVWGNIVQMGYN